MQARGLHWMAIKNTAQVCQNSVAVCCALRISVTKKYKCGALPEIIILCNFEEWRWCCGLKRGPQALGWCHLPHPICGIFLSMRRRWQCQSYSGTSPCWARQCEPQGSWQQNKSNAGIPWHCTAVQQLLSCSFEPWDFCLQDIISYSCILVWLEES